MLRDAGREEIRKVALPLWTLLHSTQWPGQPGAFDPIKNGACAIVAHLAYCAVGDDERERKNRAKVVPCRVYQELLAGEPVDFIEALASVDFANVEIVRTRYFVAVIFPAHERLLIGVRGTQFAYDWLINVNVFKRRGESGTSFHRGFLREAEKLAEAVNDRLLTQYGKQLTRKNCAIYLAGHSLGGAVAAILNQMQFRASIHGCYIFATPRISEETHFAGNYQPFQTRRDLDIIPHCPPRLFGYSDFAQQVMSTGQPYVPAGGIELYFFASWLLSLALNQFPKNHSMERYRLEVLEPFKQHPDISRRWKQLGVEDIPL
jgi:hypothetical protein